MTMVGMHLKMDDGSYLVDANMLNGVVMMILFTCIISSVVVENSARRILLREKMQPEETEKTGDARKYCCRCNMPRMPTRWYIWQY